MRSSARSRARSATPSTTSSRPRSSRSSPTSWSACRSVPDRSRCRSAAGDEKADSGTGISVQGQLGLCSLPDLEMKRLGARFKAILVGLLAFGGGAVQAAVHPLSAGESFSFVAATAGRTPTIDSTGRWIVYLDDAETDDLYELW